jgi:hypothetical protein
VAASRTAELLVLGRVPHSTAALATAVAAAADCPVLVAPVDTAHGVFRVRWPVAPRVLTPG